MTDSLTGGAGAAYAGKASGTPKPDMSCPDRRNERSDAASAAGRALERLKAGNREFLHARTNTAIISQEAVRQLYNEGQHPFAAIITCSDSRVVPEHIFMTGLGDLFTIRTAGNAVDDLEAASAYYAAAHLHVPLIVVMGHTQCGAVASAQAADYERMMAPLLDPIAKAIGNEKDPYAASKRNVSSSVAKLRSYGPIAALCATGELSVAGAVYRTSDRRVDFLP